jgi:hypothetical protein
MFDITEEDRAKARAHVELLRHQRQNPEEIFQKLERQQPSGSCLIRHLRENFEFRDKQLESLVPVYVILKPLLGDPANLTSLVLRKTYTPLRVALFSN